MAGYSIYMQATQERQLSDVLWHELRNSKEAQADGLSYDVSFPNTSKTIDLHSLNVELEHRWKGVATRFLQRLCKIADANSLYIELEVGSGDDHAGVEDLPRFYNRHGFEWVADCGYMRREPLTISDDAEVLY